MKMLTIKMINQWPKSLLLFGLSSAIIACQTPSPMKSDRKKENSSIVSTTHPQSPAPGDSARTAENSETNEGDQQDGEAENTRRPPVKIGLILSGGAIRTYAHIGVLQEFSKQKIPIHAIAGVEMGALVAGIYATKAQAFDVEWQMMKIKEKDLLDKSLISAKSKAIEVRTLDSFINSVFGSQRADQTKVPFACPALHLDQQRVYALTKGNFREMLPYCLAIPPLFKPHQQNIAAMISLDVLADQLKQRGANYIIYVDALVAPLKAEPFDSQDLIFWGAAAEVSRKKNWGYQYLLTLPIRQYDMTDFSKRRELIQKGQAAAQEAIKTLQKEIDL